MAGQRSRFHYRGTTRGWPGNESSQREERTCATSDPLVATMFAVFCRNFGTAVVQIFETTGFEIQNSGNCLADIEAEVIVQLKPEEFSKAAVATVDVERAIEILAAMGVELPVRLPASAVRLTQFLRNETRRLTDEEIAEFHRMCGVTNHE